MPRNILTRKQKRLVKELDEIRSLLGLDYEKIDAYEQEARTALLERMKDQLIRGDVIVSYTLVDEFLNMKLSRYFFGRKSFIRLWRTKKFKTFNYHVLEELSLMQKLRFVRTIFNLPKGVIKDIERLNALRNGLAHAFFPENLKKSKPFWKNKNIFTLEGIQLFDDDMEKLSDAMMKML